jgi:hypothetical protein
VVEHSTNNPKVVGSKPASGAAREKEKKIGNMVKNKDIYLLDVLQAISLTANYFRTNKLPKNDR